MEIFEQRIANLESRIDTLAAENASLRKSIDWLKPRKLVRLSPFCHIGDNADIDPTVRLMAPSENHSIRIGSFTKIRRGGEWMGPVTVGERCQFNRDSYIRANVTIGNYCNIGAFVRIVSDTHEITTSGRRRAGALSFPEIVIGNGVFIGTSVTILGNVHIGNGAVVAAGSLVNKDVAPNTLVGGVPAKKIKDLN